MPLQARREWGPSLWAFIHTIAVVDYPDDTAVHRRQVNTCLRQLRAVADAIPCNQCATHYRRHLDTWVATAGEGIYDTLALFKWSVDLHNSVNEKQLKRTITHSDALNLWVK